VVPLVPLNPNSEQDLASVQALRREVRQLRDEFQALRLWCLGLEQQQAQLAAALSLTVPAAGRGLTRFPVARSPAWEGRERRRVGSASSRAGRPAEARRARRKSARAERRVHGGTR